MTERDKQPDNVQFGSKLREIRLSQGLKLRGLAKELGIQPAHLSKVELGEIAVSEELSERISAVLKVNPVVMFAASGRVTKDLQEVIAKYPKAFADLIHHLKTIPEPEKALLRIVREVRDGEW